MKLSHKINHEWVRQPDIVIDDRYEAELSSALSRAERAWRSAEGRLRRAERAAEKRMDPALILEVERCRREVLARLDELNALKAQMESTGAAHGANWSGRSSVRRAGYPRRSL